MTLIPLLFLTLAFPTAPVQESAPKPSPEAVRARDAVADIALLESIMPLKLRPKQIDALLVPMKAAQSAYLQLVAKDDEGLKSLEPFLTKLRENAFRGKLPSRDDVKRWTDEESASVKRASDARGKAVDEIIAVLDKVLDDTQKEEVLRQSDGYFGARRVPKEFSKNPTKAPREKVIGLALSAYAQRVLVMERAIGLLGKIKTPSAP